MLTKKQDILQAIVDHLGDCSLFTRPEICSLCPLGNKVVNGRRVNCMDYLKITPERAEEDIQDVYEKAAEEELFELALEEHLSED